MKALELSQFVIGSTETYEIIIQVEVLGQLVNKRVSFIGCDNIGKKIVLHTEKIELK